ncbi:MAG: tRNA lysidine(34) synthetase TilS [Bacteroidales bacterium]|nr:tRNA lysidine(34) synthetase TilS [Bacteroidales bacterium]
MLLLAVSGGIDSVCLTQKVRLEGGPFAIAHCNFGLRGAESDADEAFVRSLAASLGVTCHVKRFDTEAFASAEGISVEMAARRLRYHWFGELCREFGYSGVAVAHNANDNAETLLLNLLRGTGVRGILGMKADGFIPDPEFGDIPLLRPLLGMTRADIEAYAKEQGLSWREDSTNASTDFKRNKIRNLVFPVFREINPRFVETLNRNMERFADELCDCAGEEKGASRRPAVPGILPSGEIIEGEKAAGDIRGQRPLQFPRAAMGLEVCTSPSVTEEPWDGSKEVKQPEGMLILDADKAGELVEGRWESGDWIRPLGAPGKKKMQDWFTDHHIPADEKPFVTLYKSAADPHHVLAIAGYCIDHSVRVTKTTRRIIRISAKND